MTWPDHASFRLLTVARRRFSGIHEALDQAPHIVIGVVLSVRDAKFPQALGLECLDSSLVVCQKSP